jgi:pyridoxal phosphate enzyme (YggS family)
MSTDWRQTLRDNVTRVQANIAAACRRAGRDPAEVRLLAVTKYVSLEVARELLAAGLVDLGENRVQQLVTRAQACGTARFDWPDDSAGRADSSPAPAAPRWHMLGHVQRNKLKTLLPHARIVHSLDSARLAEAVARQAQELQVQVDVLIEVNIAGEAAKTGALPADVPALVAAVAAFPPLRLRGLMTMTPYDPNPETSRPYFAQLRELLERLRAQGAVGPGGRHLSMGMSQDYVVAVEEGATIVRLGSALFDGLPTTDPRDL